MDLRGLLLIFIGLIGAFILYANDPYETTRATLCFLVFVGVGAHLVARAFRLRRTGGLILFFVAVAGAAVIYANDANDLLHAIVWLLAGAGAGAYVVAFASR